MNCNCIHITYSVYVLSGIWNNGFGNIEVSVICVESGCSQLTSTRREPMPEEDYDSFLLSFLVVPFDSFINSAIIISLPVKPWIMRWIILHIEASNKWFLTSFANKVIIVKCSLTRKDIFAVIISQCFVQLLGFSWSIAIDKAIKTQW